MVETQPEEDGQPLRACPACRSVYRSAFSRCPTDGATLELSARDPLLGETVGGVYVVEACVGEGAMGRVYRTHHHRLPRKKFALKVLLGDLAAEVAMRLRFAQEAEAASRLSHPNVVSVLDFDRSPSGLMYLVMEFVEGRPLARIIDEEAPLPPTRVVRLVRQLCLGLGHAHDQGLVHRDFKPDNVIVVQGADLADETPRIADFGLAIFADPNEGSARLTSAGLVVGTPIYVAPEQASDAAVDHRADLFALGVTMYEMLAGQVPHEGTTMEMLYKNATMDPPAIADRSPGVEVPPGLEAVVRRLMARNPAARFAHAREVVAALDALALRPEPSIARADDSLAPAVAPPAVLAATSDPELAMAETGVALEPVSLASEAEEAAAPAASVSAASSPLAKERPQRSRARWIAAALAGAVAIAGAAVLARRAQREPAPVVTTLAADATPPAVPAEAPPASAVAPGVVAPAAGELPSGAREAPPAAAEIPSGTREAPPAAGEAAVRKNESAEVTARELKPRAHRQPAPATRTRSKPTAAVSSRPEPAEPTEPSRPEPPAASPPALPTPVLPTPALPAPKLEPPPTAAPPPLDARARSTGLNVRGSLPSSELEPAIARVAAEFRSCYRSAARRAGHAPKASIAVSFVIDETRRARFVKVAAAPLAGLSECLRGAVSAITVRRAPDVGDAKVSFDIAFTPLEAK